MRQILFRGKRIENGEWYKGSLHLEYEGVTNKLRGAYLIGKYSPAYDNAVHGYIKVDPETVSEFVGIVDKNGKKIFEGDILKITDEFGNSVIWSVDCKNTAFSINQKGVNYSTYLGEYDTGRCDIEIIGNIYDTPELFEVKE